MSLKKIVLSLLFMLSLALLYYLFRPISNIPEPANFSCLNMDDGYFLSKDSLPSPNNIYGMGLTYSQHLIETAAEYDASVLPPIFKKKAHTLVVSGTDVKLPSSEQMIISSGEFEEGVSDKLEKEFNNLSAMLDYEVELGLVLLETVSKEQLMDDAFVPPLGFFLANDLSARSVGLLGEGTSLRYDYWGISKSFPGFMPMSDSIWIPNTPDINGIPCIRIETYVNGEVRQSQTTDNMIYTPIQLLRFIQQKYDLAYLKKGDMILSGTPGGVAIATPRVLVRLSNLLGFDRYKKLSLKLNGDLSGFLKDGDEVEVRGEALGSVRNKIIED